MACGVIVWNGIERTAEGFSNVISVPSCDRAGGCFDMELAPESDIHFVYMAVGPGDLLRMLPWRESELPRVV